MWFTGQLRACSDDVKKNHQQTHLTELLCVLIYRKFCFHNLLCILLQVRKLIVWNLCSIIVIRKWKTDIFVSTFMPSNFIHFYLKIGFSSGLESFSLLSGQCRTLKCCFQRPSVRGKTLMIFLRFFIIIYVRKYEISRCGLVCGV